MPLHRPGPSVLQLRSRQTPSRALAARGQKEEKGEGAGNHSSVCFICGSCDRKCKVRSCDFSQRWIAAGETQCKHNRKKFRIFILDLQFIILLLVLGFNM